ncbi:hypothetical protein XI06_15065 [Bradyrhizobium sp. CCBAU 11434]|uniref:hypothetical protein n=1 Tax=Bradyrhizobium sp. CCBAU 11434 TaxID=1630885 RepID=UPI002305B281|nr:hypothetical protein [Bradyrhizobium sp. CCBAU 11434]MDA9521628.1 hypothetical protein [Bradyrhizobium sp. CCBAU 11434]
MGETITIPLKKPLIAPEGPVNQVVLREPTFDEFLVHGDPYTVARSVGGVPFAAENPEVIAQYMKLCLVEPKDPQVLRQGKARLAKEMKEALLSFFHPDAAASEDSSEA